MSQDPNESGRFDDLDFSAFQPGSSGSAPRVSDDLPLSPAAGGSGFDMSLASPSQVQIAAPAAPQPAADVVLGDKITDADLQRPPRRGGWSASLARTSPDVALLGVAFGAMLIACGALFFELWSYGFNLSGR